MDTLFLHPTKWDLMVDDYGNIAMAEKPYAIAQDVASACRLWEGEARYRTDRGMPYESILGELPPESLLASWFDREAETVPEVESSQTIIDYHREERTLSGQIQITTADSETLALSIS